VKKQFVVRIEAYEGEGSSIKLTSDNNDSLGEMYCVGQVADDGVVDLIDNGYPSLGELYEAWPHLKKQEKVKAGEDRLAASCQIEELVFNDSVDTLIDFLADEQVQQLAHDWRAGKDTEEE
jgi:hypothetical protein